MEYSSIVFGLQRFWCSITRDTLAGNSQEWLLSCFSYLSDGKKERERERVDVRLCEDVFVCTNTD